MAIARRMSRPAPRAPPSFERISTVSSRMAESDPRIVDHGAEERLLRRRRESQPALARVHPVRVAGDRVDLAVVTEHPERLRALPRRRGVGGVPLVEHDERRLDVGIEEVGIERGEPVRGGERLVRDGREAARRDVHIAIRRTRERVDPASHPVRALFRTRGVIRRGRAEHRLEDARPRVAGVVPQRRGIDRNVAPTHHAEPLTAAGVFDGRADLARRPPVADEQHEERQAAMPRRASRRPRAR